MARKSNYNYDPKTGSWSKTTSDVKEEKQNTPKNTPQPTSSKGSMTSSDTDKNSSRGKAEKKYNNIEINTLTGNLNYIVTPQTVKLSAGDTVKLKGLGKYLSGNYYVQDVTRQISSSGYTHSATLIKTDFGKTLKLKTKKKEKKTLKKKKSSNI